MLASSSNVLSVEKRIAAVNFRPPLLSKGSCPKLSNPHAEDNGSIRITCQGQKSGYLAWVPENCSLALQMPSVNTPGCTIQRNDSLRLGVLSGRVTICDPLSECLLSQRLTHIRHDHNYCQNYCQPPSPGKHTDSQAVALHSAADSATPPARKVIRLNTPSPTTDPEVTSHNIEAPGIEEIQRKRKQNRFRRDTDQNFQLCLQTAIRQNSLPGWSQQVHDSERAALIDSFIYYCAARERARHQKFSSPVPLALSHPRFNCSMINGSNAQRFCNVHREDDRESIGILDIMRKHPSYRAYLTSKTMTDTEFTNFLLTLVIARLFNSTTTLKNLGFFSPENLDVIHQDYRSNPDRYKKLPAYQLNATYGKAGMDMGQFIFELIPQAIRLFPVLSSRQQRPMRIETLSKELNSCLKEALLLWYQKQPDGIAIHELQPPRATAGNPALSKRARGVYEFKMQDGKIMRKKRGSRTSFAETHTTPDTLNYQFNFSQAFADAARLCPELVDPDSGMIPGTGTRQALTYLRGYSKSAPDVQQELEALHAEIKSQWPEALGPFNIVTLEHSLCEWTRWVANILGCRKLNKPYRPRAALPAAPERSTE